MKFIYIGKIVNTHGIKGEVRLLSQFDKKELVFKKDFVIYIGEDKEKEVIASYRVHKNFDMITLKGMDNINDVLKYKGKKVYINREDLNLNQNEYMLDDLLGMKIVCENENYGIVQDVYDNHGNTLLEIEYKKNYYIPLNSDFIKNVDITKKEIETINIKDLMI